MESSILASALSKIDAVLDALTVKRVFGDAYEADGVTVIPVAAIKGGGGAGSGEGHGPAGAGTGSGAGMGGGVDVRPVGVYVIKDGRVTWRPAVDLLPIVLGVQAVALAAALTIRQALRHRRRR